MFFSTPKDPKVATEESKDFIFESDLFLLSDSSRIPLSKRGRRITSPASDFKALQIQILHFLPGPGCFAEKNQARFDGWIVGKAVDPDQIGQLRPAVKIDQLIQDHLQGFSVKGVVLLGGIHFSNVTF